MEVYFTKRYNTLPWIDQEDLQNSLIEALLAEIKDNEEDVLPDPD